MEKIENHFRYLQDPQLVARFQRVCGIRAAFSDDAPSTCRSAEQAHFHNNGALHHYTAGEAGEELLAGSGAQRRSAGETDPQKMGHGVEDVSPKGVASSGRVSTLKPLRRNSLTGEAGQEFVIQNRFLFFFFTLGTELGNELFYTLFFPFLVWNVDAFVGRRLIMVWVWVMYLGQCTKDVFGWPRPASPPVVKVEMFYNSEYSMPSTHAMSGTAIPFSLFFLSHGRWEYSASLGLTLALCWCLLVCSSRIYMGMHSVLDVIAGFLYSILILLFFLPALDLIDGFNLSSRFAPPAIVFITLTLALLSFTLDSWSTSRGDTAQILGVGAGVALASHVNRLWGFMPDLAEDQLPLTVPVLTAGLVWAATLRFLLGVLVLVAIRALMKAVTIPLVCWVNRVSSSDLRKARQNMEVELPYRYIVYGTMGFSLLFLVPLLFTYLRL